MFVKHSEFGYGEILPTTEVVEEEVVVSVDVMFEHGVERNVSTYDLEDLSEEELQELSKNTLKSYAGKAMANRDMHIGARDYNDKKGYESEHDEYEAGMSGDKRKQKTAAYTADVHFNASAKHQSEIDKRSKGLTNVSKKLKEDYEAPENVIRKILEAKIDVRGEAQIADFKSRL